LGHICEQLNRSQRFYLWGSLCGVLAGFWYITSVTEFFAATLIVSIVLLTCGVVSDLLLIYKTVWETSIGKGLLLLLLAFSTNLAYSMSSRVVNELVKFDTSDLTYTVNFVAFLLAPIFLFIGTSIVFAIVLGVSQLYLMVVMHAKNLRSNKCFGASIPAPIESYPVSTFFARMMAFSIIFGTMTASADLAIPSYAGFVERAAASFIFYIEAAHYSRCEILPSERVITVNDQEIIAVTNVGGTIKFSPKKCTPLINS
jgi:hypothetical protein